MNNRNYTYKAIPDGDDILAEVSRKIRDDGRHRDEATNLQLHLAFNALIATLPPEQRLKVLNVVRGRDSFPDDCPVYVSSLEDEDE